MNKNVREYLAKVNQREEDRWERWSTYRQTLTDLSIKVLLEYPKREVLMIGSGAVDDFDLHRLIAHASSLSFLDLDIEATKDGIKRQGLNTNDFMMIQQDLTGFDDIDFFDSWHQFMLGEPSFVETILFIDQKMKQIQDKDSSLSMKKTFDVVIVCPIYTQLIYHEWVEMVNQQHPKSWSLDEISKLKAYVLDLMVPIIDHVNKTIKALVKQGGKVIAISDIIEWNRVDFQTFEKAHPSLSEYELMEYYLSYVNQYGMGLGDYGLWSLREGSIEQTSRFLLWPFSHERVMLVQMMMINQ